MPFTYRFVQNKFLISFYKKLFLSILTSFPPKSPPPPPTHTHTQLYAKGLVWSLGGKHFSKTFSISYMLNSKNSVLDPYFLIGTGPMQKTLVRIKYTIFFMEKISFSLKLFFLPFLWAILH